MGGGASESGGKRAAGGKLNPANIVKTEDMLSKRGELTQEVDDTLSVMRDINKQYGYIVGDLQIATLKGRDARAMAYYDGSNIAVNKTYFNSKAMADAYAESVQSGWHPSNGNKTAMEAVIAHEVGHALSDKVAEKMGITGLGRVDTASTRIVDEARKKTKDKGNVIFGRQISDYATASNAETVAEAFSDVYCNGKKAKAQSRAVVEVINSYLSK